MIAENNKVIAQSSRINSMLSYKSIRLRTCFTVMLAGLGNITYWPVVTVEWKVQLNNRTGVSFVVCPVAIMKECIYVSNNLRFKLTRIHVYFQSS